MAKAKTLPYKDEYVLSTNADEMIEIDMAIKGYLIKRAKYCKNIKEALDENNRLLKTHKIIQEMLYHDSNKFFKETIKEMEEAIKEVKNETNS